MGIDVKETVYGREFIFGLGTLTHPDGIAVCGFYLCRHNDLGGGYAHDFVPTDVFVTFYLRTVLRHGNDPVCQDGKVEMCLYATVGLVVYRADVEVGQSFHILCRIEDGIHHDNPACIADKIIRY